MAALNAKEFLVGNVQRGLKFMRKDLEAISSAQHAECPGGVAKTPLIVVAECAAVNHMVATWLTTGAADRIPADQREPHFAAFDTAEKALAYLETETALLIEAYETLDESTLGDVSEEPLGFPMTRFAVAALAASHMMYHDGQLNYVQSLCGDDKMHWFDD